MDKISLPKLSHVLTRTISSSSSPTLESGGDRVSMEQRSRRAGYQDLEEEHDEPSTSYSAGLPSSSSSSAATYFPRSHETLTPHASQAANSSQRPPIWSSNSYNASTSVGSGLANLRKLGGGGSFAKSRGFDNAPPLHITVNNQAPHSRVNTGRLTGAAQEPPWPRTPGTASLFTPNTATATTSVARRAIRSRTSLFFSIGLAAVVFSMYFRTFHPEASDALLRSATAPLESAANAAKAAIKGGGSKPSDVENDSWRDLLGFGNDLMDINSWGLLNSGRDKDGFLPLSPWKRFDDNWERSPEDGLLQDIHPENPDGRILVEEGKPHPIPFLISRAKKRWAQLKARQSKTFAEAVKEYQRRHGRHPPRGFDRWYAFAKANNVKLIDEFDIIEHSLRPFRAFEPASFRRRASKAASIVNTWRIRVTRGQVYREGELGHHDRAAGIVQMCQKFKHELADMIIGYNGHDGARVNIGWEERMRLEDLIEDGLLEKYEPKDSQMNPVMQSPPPGWGIPQTCETGSAMRDPTFDFQDPNVAQTGLEMPPRPLGGVGSLIGSFKNYVDVCNSPDYRHYHASTSWSYQTWPTTVMPLFTPGVHARFGDVYCIIDEQFRNEAPEGLAWEQRTQDKAVWRGQASGPFYESSTPWQSTQRPRLHLISHNHKGTRELVVTDGNGLVRRKTVKNSQVNPLFFDTGIVGPAVQCLEEDGTCDKMGEVFEGFDDRLTIEDQEDYKYQLDVDGNSWSGRFRRLMLGNGVVLKATIFSEFWTDWAIPWLHYIPIQVDYSDIHDIMAFFRGGPSGEGAHDHLAKEIALEGKAWAREHMRLEDIEAYTFRQLLEYGRLYNADREDMDFILEVPDYEPVWYTAY